MAPPRLPAATAAATPVPTVGAVPARPLRQRRWAVEWPHPGPGRTAASSSRSSGGPRRGDAGAPTAWRHGRTAGPAPATRRAARSGGSSAGSSGRAEDGSTGRRRAARPAPAVRRPGEDGCQRLVGPRQARRRQGPQRRHTAAHSPSTAPGRGRGRGAPAARAAHAGGRPARARGRERSEGEGRAPPVGPAAAPVATVGARAAPDKLPGPRRGAAWPARGRPRARGRRLRRLAGRGRGGCATPVPTTSLAGSPRSGSTKVSCATRPPGPSVAAGRPGVPAGRAMDALVARAAEGAAGRLQSTTTAAPRVARAPGRPGATTICATPSAPTASPGSSHASRTPPTPSGASGTRRPVACCGRWPSRRPGRRRSASCTG